MQTAVFTASREINIRENSISLPKDDEVLIGLKDFELYVYPMPFKTSLKLSSLLNHLLKIPTPLARASIYTRSISA